MVTYFDADDFLNFGFSAGSEESLSVVCLGPLLRFSWLKYLNLKVK